MLHQSIILLNYHMKALILLLTLILIARCENTNFDYKDHGDNWGAVWQDCDPNNEDKNQQSPIQLLDQIAQSNQSFLFSNFYKADAALSFLNTTVYLKSTNTFGEIYSKTINGDIVVLKATEIRFRSHSEHKIYQKFYDLQMQIFFTEVYPSVRNERLGLALLFQQEEGSTNQILKTIKDSYPDQTKVNLDLSELLNNDQPFDFWYYLGSATIPNCKNGALKWIVSKKIFKMSQQERNFFWNLFNNQKIEGNYRNIQPIRGNKIDYFHFSSL